MKLPLKFVPSIALALQLVGLYSLAGWVTQVLPDGSAAYILIRGLTVLVALVAFTMLRGARSTSPVLLLPVVAFLSIYTGRVLENVISKNVAFPPDTTVALLGYFVQCLLMSLVFVWIAPRVEDKGFHKSMMVLALLFLTGLLLNLNSVLGSLTDRLSLEKINPISMGHQACSFLLYLMIRVTTPRQPWKVEALLIVLMFLVLAFARSRGAYVSLGGAFLFFLVLRSRNRRVFAFTILAAAALAANPGPLIAIIERLATIDASRDMSTALRLLAFMGAWNQFLFDPVLGRYAIELQTQWYPHNIYLESLMAVGAVGSFFLYLHVLIALRAATGLILRRDTPIYATFLALLFVKEAIGNGFSGSLFGSNVFWLTSIATIAVWATLRKADPVSVPDHEITSYGLAKG